MEKELDIGRCKRKKRRKRERYNLWKKVGIGKNEVL